MSAKQDRQVVRTAAELERKYKLGKKSAEEEIRRIADIVYPVGSIYLAYSHISPATLFGGKWVRLENAFLLAVDSGGEIGATGGEATHILTASEMPAHRHQIAVHSSGGSAISYEVGHLAEYSSQEKKGWAGYTATSGGGNAHNNMPPYIQISAWRRTA